MTRTLDPIRSFLEAYRAAVYAKNLEAFLALYDAEVEVFDAWEQWRCSGIAAWQEAISGWFGSLGSDRVVVEFDEIGASVDGDLAAGHAFVTFAAVSPEGVRLRALDSRISLVLRRTADRWRVVHEHTSAPASFESKAVSLIRPRR